MKTASVPEYDRIEIRKCRMLSELPKAESIWDIGLYVLENDSRDPTEGEWVEKGRIETPWEISGEPVLLSYPEHEWEQRLFHVNEGPAVLERSGSLYLTYSASGTDHNYCMGLLKASGESDILDPASWVKNPEPVFQSCDETGIYGPGHSCFSRTEDDRTDILVYHARSYKEIEGNPLNDPNRHTRVQKILWDSSENPVFGKPIPDSEKTE